MYKIDFYELYEFILSEKIKAEPLGQYFVVCIWHD